jgi:cyclophilin family peptidyl-prolyl cis-trans isomerase
MKHRLIPLLLATLLLAALPLFLLSCGKQTEEPTYTTTVVIEVADYGSITVELYPRYAPTTVYNFQKLVAQGFYDGLTFHRVVSGFMIQGGDPNGDGTGGSPDTIKGEFSQNGYTKNTLSHTRGVISMARSSSNNDSASSQFFIVHQDSTFLDGSYAAFGRVTDGMDVVDAIAAAEVTTNSSGEMSKPVKTITITRIYFI